MIQGVRFRKPQKNALLVVEPGESIFFLHSTMPKKKMMFFQLFCGSQNPLKTTLDLLQTCAPWSRNPNLEATWADAKESKKEYSLLSPGLYEPNCKTPSIPLNIPQIILPIYSPI